MRDEFPARTKSILAGRAGHVCSNPECQLATSGAALGEDGKVVVVGVAAHINAAAPGGPRYDPQQTAEERRSTSNGIWLCTAHAKQIDDDPKEFTVDKLKAWKHSAEQRSALAILTLQKRDLNAVRQVFNPLGDSLGRRSNLASQESLSAVTATMRQAATRDLAAFIKALKLPANTIPLGLRLIEGQQVMSFQAAGLAAAIGTFNELVLVAAPGTGKTTTLLQVADGIASNQQSVATFIPLSEWSAQAHTILQSVMQRAAFAGGREEHLRMLADAGRLVLVMDGWNELNSDSRKRLRIEIQGLQRDYPGLGIVISTRVHSLDVPISGPVVEIEPLSETQQLLIARTYRGEIGEGILDEAWRTRGLRDLVAIPLYLTKLLSDTQGTSLPTTKEEVLRLFVSEIDRNADKREALEAVAFGFHAEMLSAIATEATFTDSVSISSPRARSLISEVTGRLLSDGQISSAPQPEAVLTVLVSHHLLVRTSTGVEFQHQQFQEWFASHEVEKLMLAAAAGDWSARQRLRTTIINEYAWEEAILFACERASRGGADSISSAAELVVDALNIDPMLAAEAIYRSSEALWSVVKDRVVAFAVQWHTPTEIDRAVRFMVKTGNPQFAETIWAFVGNPNDHVYLEALRAGGRFRPPVLGGDAGERIARLAAVHRSHVLSELVMYGGIEGIETATGLAISDCDIGVKVAVAEALHFRQANRQIRRLLADAPTEVWQALARNGYGEEFLEPEIAERLHREFEQLIEDEENPARKLHALLRSAGGRQDRAEKVQYLIEMAEFGDERHGVDAIYEANRLYPDEVRKALIGRLQRRLRFPFYAERLLKDAGVVIDDGPIAELALAPDIGGQLVSVAAGLLGPITTGKLIDALLALRAQLSLVPHPTTTSDEYHRVLGLLALTPVESIATAVISRASISDPSTIEDLADLLARHGQSDDRWRLGLGKASRRAMIDVVLKWTETLLVDEKATRRAFAEVAQVIEVLAAPELAAPLTSLLSRDLAQWRQQRQEYVDAMARGRNPGTSEAQHSWTLRYGRAFAAIGSGEAIATLQSHLAGSGYCGFGIDAARALNTIWEREQGITDDIPFGKRQQFSDVRSRRAEREVSVTPATSAHAETIFGAIDRLLQSQHDDESQIHALQLAAIGLRMPYGNKQVTIARLLQLPRPYSAKLGLLTALVSAGEMIEVTLVINGINALLEDAKSKPWLLQENQGTIGRWLALLPFTNRPEATLEVLAGLDKQILQPWRVRPLLAALGFAPSVTAERILLRLAQEDARFLEDHDWFAALEKRGTLSSLIILLNLINQDAAKGRRGAPDLWTFGHRLAAGIQAHPGFRANVYAKMATNTSPTAKAIMEYAVAEAPDETGVMLILKSRASTGREFDGLLGSAIEHLVVMRRPSSEWVGAYEQVSSPAPSLRKRLFAIARSSDRSQAKLASACLIHIDKLRDQNGVAAGEARHPDIDTGAPWPLLNFSADSAKAITTGASSE